MIILVSIVVSVVIGVVVVIVVVVVIFISTFSLAQTSVRFRVGEILVKSFQLGECVIAGKALLFLLKVF